MRCLVVGGTGFLGGAITDALARGGHDVAVLSRGETARALPEGARVLRADRHGNLSALGEVPAFDCAFDTCAYAPDAVDRLLDALGPSLGRYVLVSSLSVHGSFAEPGLTEDAPLPDASEEDLALAASLPLAQRASAEAYGASYGRLKRACERAAEARLGARASVLRAGLLVGAGDITDRLTWWVRRLDMAQGDRRRVPAPAPAKRPVQMIDVRDAAEFAIRCAQDGLGGAWTLTGAPLPFRDLLGTIREATGSRAEIAWIEPDEILRCGVRPWTDMPLMVPPTPEFRHFFEMDSARARAAGLLTRPLAETLAPLVAWDRGRRGRPLAAGLSPDQEAALLGARPTPPPS